MGCLLRSAIPFRFLKNVLVRNTMHDVYFSSFIGCLFWTILYVFRLNRLVPRICDEESIYKSKGVIFSLKIWKICQYFTITASSVGHFSMQLHPFKTL
jgi:hypothetical protein